MAKAAVYATPIPARAPMSWARLLSGIAFNVAWFVGICCINASQFLLLPLRIIPHPAARALYDAGIRESKGAFATLLLLMSQWFAPTTLCITAARTGPGAFTPAELEALFARDAATGRVAALNLPRRAVLVSNHQVYLDWWYLWSLLYFARTHKDVLIVLKRSLRLVPILGWGMRFFRFVFLARSWAADRAALAHSLTAVAARARAESAPLAFVLYPEGTLVSRDTRPLSKKYADKMGVPDTRNVLLPRSTGLLHALRALAPPAVPGLQLLDLTLAYPGVPRAGYGQDFYTLRSVFLAGAPPPSIHVHLRRFDVADIPLGALSSDRAEAGAREVPKEEAEAFEQWLHQRWREKDDFLDRFHDTGTFAEDPEEEGQLPVEVPLQTRAAREVLYAYCFFVPVALAWAGAQARRVLTLG